MNIETLEALGITREEIINKVVERLLLDYEKQDMFTTVYKIVKEELIKKANPLIERAVETAAAEILNTPYSPVDEWGDPKGKPTTLKAEIKNVAVGYLAVKVDKDGKPKTYNTSWTRGEYLVATTAKEVFEKECKPQLQKSVEQAKAHLQAQVAEYIAKEILKK